MSSLVLPKEQRIIFKHSLSLDIIVIFEPCHLWGFLHFSLLVQPSATLWNNYNRTNLEVITSDSKS